MADEILKRDQNFRTVIAGVTNDAAKDIVQVRMDPSTLRILVDAYVTGPAGAGLATEATLLKIPGLSIPIHDYIGVAYPNGTTETYTFKTGGSGGTTVATVTVVYTDSTKANLSSVTKT